MKRILIIFLTRFENFASLLYRVKPFMMIESINLRLKVNFVGSAIGLNDDNFSSTSPSNYDFSFSLCRCCYRTVFTLFIAILTASFVFILIRSSDLKYSSSWTLYSHYSECLGNFFFFLLLHNGRINRERIIRDGNEE